MNKLLNGKSKPEINITSKKKIIDFQINQLIKLKKKIFFLSHVSFNSLKNYVNNNYSNKIKFEFIEKSVQAAGCLKHLINKKFNNFILIDGDLIFNVDLKNF